MLSAVTTNIAGDFSTTSGMTNKDTILNVKFLYKNRKIVSVGVHVVAIPALIRSSMTATIMRNATKTIRTQEYHLVLPGIRVQRPTMTEDYGLPIAPVFIKYFCTIFYCN